MATSWTQLKADILAEITGPMILRKEFMVDGQSTTFRDIAEVHRALELCDLMILQEGSATGRQRVNYANTHR